MTTEEIMNRFREINKELEVLRAELKENMEKNKKVCEYVANGGGKYRTDNDDITINGVLGTTNATKHSKG